MGRASGLLNRLTERFKRAVPGGDEETPRSGSGATAAADPPPTHVEWACECGERYRTVGAGRHAVHWKADADEGDPVLGTTCPSCDRPLAAPSHT
jgi:hypothetical protein